MYSVSELSSVESDPGLRSKKESPYTIFKIQVTTLLNCALSNTGLQLENLLVV